MNRVQSADLRGSPGRRARTMRILGGRRPGRQGQTMVSAEDWVVIGLDNGGTSNNATVLDATGRFLVDRLVELPSQVLEGPDVAVEALARATDNVLTVTGIAREKVRAVGLDTPGPASAEGVISSK